MTIIVSVDPGITGAMAWLRLRPDDVVALLAVEDMPTAEAKQGQSMKSHILLPTLATLLRNGHGLFEAEAVVVEEVNAMPGQGVTSMFRFGAAFGAIQGVAAGLGLPVHLVRPQRWQAVARVRKGDDAGRVRANELFPRKSELFARKKDHNRADAALIGYAFLCELRGRPLLTV